MIIAFLGWHYSDRNSIERATSSDRRIPSPPKTLGTLSWEWDDDVVSSIQEAWSTPSGAIFRTEGHDGGIGLLALNTSTGKPAWHFRYEGDGRVWMSPDRRTTVIWHQKSGFFPWRAGESVEVYVLDTATGEVREQREAQVSLQDPALESATNTANAFVTLEPKGDGAAIEARDLISNELLWSKDFGGRCGFRGREGDAANLIATDQNKFIVSTLCSVDGNDRSSISAYDEFSGEEEWGRTLAAEEDSAWSKPAEIESNSTGHWERGQESSQIISAEAGPESIIVRTPYSPVVLDSEKGDPIFTDELDGRDILSVIHASSDSLMLKHTTGLSTNGSNEDLSPVTRITAYDTVGKEREYNFFPSETEAHPTSVVELDKSFAGMVSRNGKQEAVAANRDTGTRSENITISEDTGIASGIFAKEQASLVDESMFFKAPGAIVAGRVQNGRLHSIVGMA
ncbi:hypothetical protein [Nocardiopsis halophila]|uniref:hypothetical protein n=1 Tax=Nocardiopsis halophila TaxID=141692 RepID=UPI0012687C40|nr:hypothetical protein [Nocardiopsis halophila]